MLGHLILMGSFLLEPEFPTRVDYRAFHARGNFLPHSEWGRIKGGYFSHDYSPERLPEYLPVSKKVLCSYSRIGLKGSHVAH